MVKPGFSAHNPTSLYRIYCNNMENNGELNDIHVRKQGFLGNAVVFFCFTNYQILVIISKVKFIYIICKLLQNMKLTLI
jgi:hypothetical protein